MYEEAALQTPEWSLCPKTNLQNLKDQCSVKYKVDFTLNKAFLFLRSFIIHYFLADFHSRFTIINEL